MSCGDVLRPRRRSRAASANPRPAPHPTPPGRRRRGQRGPTKTGRARFVELSTQLQGTLATLQPDLFGETAPVFPSSTGTPIEYQNFRARVFKRIVRKAFGKGRRVTPHCLRHTFASLHLARGINLKWVQEAGGWTSAKMLLDVYGHFVRLASAITLAWMGWTKRRR